MIKIKKEKFQYYPETYAKDFYKVIYGKKEFHDNIIPKYDDSIEVRCPEDKSFKLLPQQRFLKNFISLNTPYNSILIYHGVGTGKTCAAITVAENFRDISKIYHKKIIIIAGKDIQENFVRTIFDIDKEDFKKKKR